ncbi:efflux RND transporter permease subunit [Desulfotomaculum copahuensis]|uniref:Multidrug transporter AcrB n=1 Tax=Desulfotomaculum copahuensis TaxID=1838280 RepID=A0A1B7LBE5_9FIRM|nr:efflux RND transporter permease subunit [Desulfotomaculum copahuensis]OAT79810.1 multidrug transporter AcrB [Desulfotomaculum copahuensis]
MSEKKLGIAGKIAAAFLNSKITPVLVLAALLLGIFAVVTTPKEEDPQIVVPMVEIFIPFQGASAQEVEAHVTTPLEKILWYVKGVDYIYSKSMPGMAMVTVRFKVGSDQDSSLFNVYNQIYSNMDKMPMNVGQPLIKPKAIEDVPIDSITLWSDKLNAYQLRRIGLTVADEVNRLHNIYKVDVLGGEPRQITVSLSPDRLSAYHVSPLQIAGVIRSANMNSNPAAVSRNNYTYQVQTGGFLSNVQDIGDLVVGVYQNRPVYLRDVAKVKDGPGDVTNYVLFGTGPAAAESGLHAPVAGNTVFPAVTITVAKKKGANAVIVSGDVLNKINALKGSLIPADVHVTVTRDYGASAAEKSNELIEHMIIAVVSVFLLILVMLGFREALVVGVALPVTLAIALFLSEMYGYTLNRVTLFALIFAIGILVDDAIVVVENINRWCHLREVPTAGEVIQAVDEVGNPTILATLTVITVLLPMAYVTGMMGPYMRPIPINASVAMFFSLLVAFVVTPWFALRLLRNKPKDVEQCETDMHGGSGPKLYYRRVMQYLLDHRKARYTFVIGLVVLLGASFLLITRQAVIMKMLPFDNKEEVQVVLRTKDGTTLEQTAKAARAVGDYLATVNEVSNYVTYVGIPAPVNFNGLVRWYDIQKGDNLATIQVDLVGKKARNVQSHPLTEQLRGPIDQIASRYGAVVKMVEVPPGPPTLSPIVAEIYGRDWEQDLAVAAQVKHVFATTNGVVDVDWMVNDPQTEYRFIPNRQAQLHGISNQDVSQTIDMLINGSTVDLLHTNQEIEPVPIILRAPLAERSNLESLLHAFTLPDKEGGMVPVSELVRQEKDSADQPIYHENLNRVIYVTGDVSGRIDSPVYAMLEMSRRIGQIKLPDGQNLPQLWIHKPALDNSVALKWGGEWTITYEVFRDLGVAFAIGLIIMYLLMVAWFKSFSMPVLIMVPIPLTLLGIIPGHWLMGAFFTATSMIGFIALAGIVVRNSILLVEFTNERLRDGVPLKEALIEAGIVRARPIILTAAAIIVGSFVIIFDPIFTGMAVSLIFGTIAATSLTLVLIPTLLYGLERRLQARRPADAGEKLSAGQ